MQYLALPLALLGITAIEALGLQLIVGNAGLLTFGHGAFFAVGAYASGLFSLWAGPGPAALAGGLALSVAAATALALAVGGPCLRLRGDYLAVATLGLSQTVENALFNWRAVGGASGFSNVPRLVGPLGIGLAATLLWGARVRFDATPLGRAIVCARDDEVVAQSFGISPWRVRLAAFVGGSALAAVAGALYVHAFAFVSPSAAGFGHSVSLLLAVVLGGALRRRGSALGAALVVGVPEALRFLPPGIERATRPLAAAGPVAHKLAAALVAVSGDATLWFAALTVALLLARARVHAFAFWGGR